MDKNYINKNEEGLIKNSSIPKVSVIVPVYNTEKYLKKCLDSIINQTLKDIEIILVDDGSTDNSINILKEYQKKDDRIILITQENKKQGAARNTGLKNAKGEFIGFIDSDDWIDRDYFEKLYNHAKKYSCDIALATNIRIGRKKTKKRLNINKVEYVENLQEKIDICKQWKNPCPTNKIYKAALLFDNNIEFPENVYCEDKLFTIRALYYANGIVSVPDINYYYYRNPDSTVNTKKIQNSKKMSIDKILAQKSVIAFLKEKKADIRDCDFWATVKDKKILGISIYRIKESIHTRRYTLFGILIKEEKF